MKKYLLIFLILLFLPFVAFADPSDWYFEYSTESNGPIGYHPDLDQDYCIVTWMFDNSVLDANEWVLYFSHSDQNVFFAYKGKEYPLDELFEAFEWARKKMEFEESGGDILIIDPGGAFELGNSQDWPRWSATSNSE